MWLRNRAEEENDLAIDPCPDCDVRFSRDAKLPMMAGTSILGSYAHQAIEHFELKFNSKKPMEEAIV